jgi:lysozyme
MTTPHLVADISRDEGLRLKAYPDPESALGKAIQLGMTRLHGLSGEPWTCGYGCTGPDVHEGTVWTLAEAERRRDAKIAESIAELDAKAHWWRSLCDARQDVLANMHFNMGWARLSGFTKALAAMRAYDYEAAAREMLDSRWATQVRGRAKRLAEQMRTGRRA